jgi:Zn finger protein HypA/HybF involved in hydrogenase expression
MHEFAIVEATVRDTLRMLKELGIEQKQMVMLRFQRGSAFSEDALRQSFEVIAKDTLLENAELVVETVNLNFTCACGHSQVITSDDLIGHMFVCPVCCAVREVDEAHDLQLVELVVDGFRWREHLPSAGFDDEH